jgi:hypothetical protein
MGKMGFLGVWGYLWNFWSGWRALERKNRGSCEGWGFFGDFSGILKCLEWFRKPRVIL